ncbi:hypothetical protein NEOLEDRAFT_1166226 [Neolentinus lepideus HHB14362 ss-1]|uniref:ARM repeat-containing protein n=1 Tax=Neolentinus lepideus HHB14362 ss-1 TaxID=1314782 RepID=A0A165WA43_9AGAM|nr:hypothetical protein NEOLEDRAFT_1166226 [Neolentinus lepideus HHB14362 ss-1]
MSKPAADEERNQAIFQKLKKTCVPLLGNSLLTPSSIGNVARLLTELIDALLEIQASGYRLTTSLISYAFFPLSTILRRNPSSEIPDQILEKIVTVLTIISEEWWWDCDLRTWEQIFMLSGAIVTGIETKGKGKTRSDETKDVAVQSLLALLRERTDKDYPKHRRVARDATARLAEIREHVQGANFIPVLGQILDSSLTTCMSQHLSLQRHSLQLLDLFVRVYIPDDLAASVLPGVVSTMTKVALGLTPSKTSSKGDIVAGALTVIQGIISRAIGDDICIKEGAVRDVNDIGDLVELITATAGEAAASGSKSPYGTPRTDSWLRGTASQLHIAINSLTPLTSHPNPTALRALTTFAATVLNDTSLTLPQTQPLLLSFLLALSLSDFDSVSKPAQNLLAKLLSPSSKVYHALWQTVTQMTRDHLAAIPRLLPTHADAKVEHSAKVIEAICGLSVVLSDDPHSQVAGAGPFSSISSGIGKLLGPSGGIEKWGWALLSVLEFIPPTIVVADSSGTQLLLENGLLNSTAFPAMTLKSVASRSTFDVLERMMRSLGRASGDECLYAVEWFIGVGLSGRTSRSVAALWCGARLLDGVSGVQLGSPDHADFISTTQSRRLCKLSRGIARSVSELWEEEEREEVDRPADRSAMNTDDSQDENLLVEYRKGLVPITLGRRGSQPLSQRSYIKQPSLHKAICLQLIALTCGILQSRSTPLFIYTLYPILHSMVAEDPYVTETASASLAFISYSTSFASSRNLVLSNFDYILDAVSRRFTHRWLDIDATKVLVLLVRLAGRDVVDRASDVVEECFDRLDEFHGYEIVVEGLIEVLLEVVKIVEADDVHAIHEPALKTDPPSDKQRLNKFFHWFHHHCESHEEQDPADYGPAPRRPWSKEEKDTNDEQGQDKEREQPSDPMADSPPTPAQALTKQIVSRSLYFLTHGVPTVRARILLLLCSAVTVLPESGLLPSIHHAWPFILNRLSDSESFVVGAAAQLIEALARHVGSFMSRRIWEDVWPRFRAMLNNLEAVDSTSALTRRGRGAVGTESAYTHSHRLYRSMLKTMTVAVRGVQAQDPPIWDLAMSCRRFLSIGAHEELQMCARDLYRAIGSNNEDAVWLVLSATTSIIDDSVAFMVEERWPIEPNVSIILAELGQDK